MPELPEVEIIKLGLEKKIIGLKIQKIQILSPKSFIGNSNLAEGQKVLKVWRRAKILGMELAGEKPLAIGHSPLARSKKLTVNSEQRLTLLFHLKMSGQLIYVSSEKRTANSEQRFIGGHPTPDMVGKMPNPHTRVIFTLESQETRDKNQGKNNKNSRLSTLATSHLYFNDQRKFGWARIVDSAQVAGDSSIKKLGPEPLEKGFNWQILKQNLLKHSKMSVKVAIMDQSVVAGVGNIYANEACFLAKLDPRKKISQLSDEEFKRLHRGIIKSLQAGIKYGGSTRVHFVDAEGHKGYFLDYAKVYGKEGYPCQGCPGKVEKISLGGRGTFFCPHCQKSSI